MIGSTRHGAVSRPTWATAPYEHMCEDGNFVYLPNPLERLLPLQCIGKLRFVMHL